MAQHLVKTVIEKATQDLALHYPKAVILFGSAARYLQGLQGEAPEDIDMLYVGTMPPIENNTYAIPVDLFFFNIQEILGIAKSLRYLPKPASRAKMFLKDNWKGYVRSDIAACLLLGLKYTEYGFLQMENEETYRDYSVQMVLHGKTWWQTLQQYAQEHRGIKGLGVDKILGLDHFNALKS